MKWEHAQAGRGITLGGIGAGNFEITQAGTFGAWMFGDDYRAEDRILPQAAFHIRIQGSGRRAQTTTLAAASEYGALPAAWRGLQPGHGSYAALYPFGWTSYTGLASRVAMRFWSPIVARNDSWTSRPVAFFDLRIANPTAKRQRVSLMFTFPNAAEHNGPNYLGPATVRTGLGSHYAVDRRTDVRGVVLTSNSSKDTPDASRSEWTIAVRRRPGQRVSYVTSWDAAGSGADIYRAFERSGVLPDRPLDRSRSAGALAVTVTLRPHQAITVSYLLSWDFPQVTYGSSSNTVWMRRYADFFGARETRTNQYVPGSYAFHQSFPIADRSLSREGLALRAVDGWWKPLATDPARPAWLRTSALNEVANVAMDGSFWEGGFVRSSDSPAGGGPRIGSQVPGTHLFFDLEGGGYADANCFDCDAYGHLMLQQLFPSLARDLLRGWTSMIVEDPKGVTPHDAGAADPWIGWSPTNSSASASSFLDEPGKYILRAWEYYLRTHDRAFLAFTLPAMRKTLAYLLSNNPPGDHLLVPGALASTYDAWPTVGHDIYTSELELLAEDGVIAATQKALALHIAGATAGYLTSLSKEFDAAKVEFEQLFWDPIGQHYKIDTGAEPYSDGYMADALLGQTFAQDDGLRDLVDPTHIVPHLKKAYPLLTQFKDAHGHILGAANGVDALGRPILYVPEANEIWDGVSWAFAASLVREAERFHQPALRTDGLQLGEAMWYQIWHNATNAFAFDEPEAWGDTSTTAYRAAGGYLRPRSVWELLDAVKPVSIPGPPSGVPASN